jgi:hydrogenase maturation protease
MIRVIGLGSPFGDDRAGWRVIELLQGQVPACVELVALDRPGAGLIAWLEGVERLVLIDALIGGLPRGEVLRIDPAETKGGTAAFSSHGLDLAGTLRLAETLALRPPQIALYGIAVGAGDTAQMHGEVEAAAQRLADRLAAALQASQTSA